MILALLPLLRFVFGTLCYASKRASRAIAALGWCSTAAITIYLLIATRDGSTITVGLGGWPAELGIVLRFDAVAAAFSPTVKNLAQHRLAAAVVVVRIQPQRGRIDSGAAWQCAQVKLQQ